MLTSFCILRTKYDMKPKVGIMLFFPHWLSYRLSTNFALWKLSFSSVLHRITLIDISSRFTTGHYRAGTRALITMLKQGPGLVPAYYGKACTSQGFKTSVKLSLPCWCLNDKANLKDLITATGLVILLKLDLNRRLISPCDLEIWWMTPKNSKALFYTTSSFVHHFKSIS